jgi:K(+)-stimulated pyrophosphate-energized sodium pump
LAAYSVASWLANTTDTTVPKRFVFEELNFETGSTALTPESVDTVSSLVAVLKAYPAVSVTLEGHTDNTGDAAANKKLSLDRATAVKGLMVKGGVTESRITSEGYGQEKPVAPNDSEQGRAKNRRLEMVVVKR